MAQGPSNKDAANSTVHASAASSAAEAFAARFEFKLSGRIYFVQPSDIDWIEAAGNYVSLHVGDKSYLLRETMHGIEGQLDPDVFVRVHRSAIVQLGRIREIQSSPGGRYQAVLKSGIRIPLGSGGMERLGILIPRLARDNALISSPESSLRHSVPLPTSPPLQKATS
jgi:two-component system LytT family response regulator